MAEPTVTILNERERAFQNRHPWGFSRAVKSLEGSPADGDIVLLRNEDGKFLARGYWNHQSQITVHVLTWDEHVQIDDDFWRSRLERSVRSRVIENEQHRLGVPNAYR